MKVVNLTGFTVSGLNILIIGHVCSRSTVIISFMYLVCVLQILYVIFRIFYLKLRTFHIFLKHGVL